MDREKVIKALECCIIDPNGLEDCKMNGCPYIKEAEETEEDESLYCQTCLFADALALLKERETQKFFVDESGKITPLPVVVRCRDCKYWKSESDSCGKCEQWHLSGVYSADWFCADGEKKK